MKRYLFIMRRPPHQGYRLAETLDLILTTAAFDQPVGVLFCDGGVLQLAPNQQAEPADLRDTAAIYAAFSVYGIDKLYVEQESLSQNGLTAGALILPVHPVRRRDINSLIASHDIVVPD